ncbi:DEAD/DEAH box helicase [Hyphococcus luteus]|uniref:DEAD-box ATP-dependent RNA helicase RhpA n=1 Tax=Hyphococcus luteus TaxID=2058213 RepID=A0A2S7KA97_9PROT|nr:DEAD/DEAH box helicase [Marinicaulis flavus]PQA89444.1 RNA helicase [Marinicaulis flavus]
MSFADLGLSPKLLEAIAAAGYETPTPIQKEAIPPALEGKDVLGIAQTGTGKTASFTLPMIERLSKGRAKARMPRSLVLAPTRELAAQVAENFEKYGVNHKLTMALLIGGVSFGDQDAKLTRGVDVLIATPGRLIDHFERGRLLLNGIEVMVVDEADRMLDMGFIPDIEKIFKLTPMTRQTLFFSATMPPEIQRITDQFLHQPVRIEVSKPATTADTITQNIVRVPSKDDKQKRAVLRELIGKEDVKNGIIFCNRKSTVDVVAKSLQKHGFNARPIHGDLAQSFRTETLDKFRNDDLQFLVASDVAARGLDIPAVSHVFNFDVPIHSDDYVHRIGRTGRAGRKGAALMLVTPADGKHLDSILKTIGAKEIEELDFSEFFEANPASERPDRKGGRDDKGGKSRSRRGERSSGDQPSRRKPKDAKEPANDQPAVEAQVEPEQDNDNQAEPKKQRDETRSSKRRRGGGDARSSRRREEAVVGLGDHVPAFLTRKVAR